VGNWVHCGGWCSCPSAWPGEGGRSGGSPRGGGEPSGPGEAELVERAVQVQRETTVSPPPPAQPCRSVRSQGGLFGGEGAGLWGQSSVAVIFALRLCADNSIPAVVQLILMKYCHYC